MTEQNIKIIDEETIEITLSNGKTYKMIEPTARHMEGLLQDLYSISTQSKCVCWWVALPSLS